MGIIFLVLCLASFLGVFSFLSVYNAELTKKQLEIDAKSVAEVLAVDAQWMNYVAMLTIRRIENVAAVGDGPLTSKEFEQAIAGSPSDLYINVADAEGNMVYSSYRTALENIAHEQHFIEARSRASVITSALHTSSRRQREVFIFSKRIMRGDEVIGVAVVTYLATAIDRVANMLELGPDAVLALYRRDGELIARYPTNDVPTRTLLPSVLAAVREGDGAVFVPSSPMDGEAKVIAYKIVPGTQMLATVALPTEKAWANYRSELLTLCIAVLPIFCALAVVAFWIAQLLKRDAQHRAALETVNETNLTLFREIHHRVKNNLQSVQSLIRLQDIPQSAKMDLQSRLGAMAAMHEHIYRRDVYEEICASELIPVVVDEVIKAYGAATQVVYDIDRVTVDRDHVTPLSLLLSELVTNALKYAFADDAMGRIKVTVHDMNNGRCQLIVADNGVGMDTEQITNKSMGIRLISGVVAQMAGSYEFSPGTGTKFVANLALTAAGHHMVHGLER